MRGLNVLSISQKAALKAEPEEHGDGGVVEDPRWEAKKYREKRQGIGKRHSSRRETQAEVLRQRATRSRASLI
jgi:hypothetical protein